MAKIDPKKLAHEVKRRIRQAKADGMSRADILEELGTSETTLLRIEAGTGKPLGDLFLSLCIWTDRNGPYFKKAEG